jgi:hypothetical protein
MEVIENAYKGYFFKIWRDNGLINGYDMFCLEYAYITNSGDGKGNYENIHKARLLFYLEHGNDQDRKKKYTSALSDINTTPKQFKKLADEYMPDVTTVVNIEYQTKRKFYKSCDKDIEDMTCNERKDAPKNPDGSFPLERLYKIVDRRKIFLNGLTSDSFSFRKEKSEQTDPDGKPIYTDMWARLRSCKVGGMNCDKEILRNYSQQLDEEVIKSRLASAIGSYAVHNGNIDSDFLEDFEAAVSSLNDNHKINFNSRAVLNGEEVPERPKKSLTVKVFDENGAEIETINGSHLSFYKVKKAIKNKTVKNRRRELIEKYGFDGSEQQTDGELPLHARAGDKTQQETVTDMRIRAAEFNASLNSETHKEEVKASQYKITNAIRKKYYDKGYAAGVKEGLYRRKIDEENALNASL